MSSPLSRAPQRVLALLVLTSVSLAAEDRLADQIPSAATGNPDMAQLAATEGTGTIVADGKGCTLGDAITSANTDIDTGGCTGAGGVETIQLDGAFISSVADETSSTHFDGAFAALPDVESEMTITAGTATLISRLDSLTCPDDGVDHFRLLNVVAGGRLTLDGVTLENGCAPSGGAVYVQGELVLVDSVFRDNTAQGVDLTAIQRGGVLDGRGGAVYVADVGELESVTGTVFEDNRAVGLSGDGSNGEGGALMIESGAAVGPIQLSLFRSNEAIGGGAAFDGGRGRGGAVYSREDLTVNDTRFESNRAQGGSGSVAAGGEAVGGAVHVNGAAATFERVVFEGDQAKGGVTASPNFGGRGWGGAIYVEGLLSISDARIAGSSAVGGNSLIGTGGTAAGGAILSGETLIVAERVTVSDSWAQGGSGGGGGSGGAARGGAINSPSGGTGTNITLSGNLAIGGNTAGSLGGGASGGGWWSAGTLDIVNGTVIGNVAAGGTGTSDGTAAGGGVFHDLGIVSFVSSILGSNAVGVAGGSFAANDCDTDSGTFVSHGYNLVETASGQCPFVGTNDQTGLSPGVIGLVDLGCATPLPDGSCVPVHALPVESPAVDQGSCTVAGVAEDARETARPFDVDTIANADDGCDAGAHELFDQDGNGDDDFFLFTDGFESGDTTGWS